ncbi:MAG: hypothetical protein JRI67_06790 [Deltaproteobacteria bacterium]|nr:hypothetical protein [Deltaproteobacteria bacterium]
MDAYKKYVMTWSKLIPVVLVFALFSADAFAKGVSLMLNKSFFVAGDRMEVKCKVSATDIPAQSADVYFALGTPDAKLYCMDTDGLMGDPNVISAALLGWPVVDVVSATLFAIDLPSGIPSGTYAWYLVLCQSEKDAKDKNNWLASDAYQWGFEEGNSTGMEVLRSERQRNSAPDVTEADLTELVSGNSDFAFDLYHEVREEAENLFYSPHSISLALAMTYAGARNNTESQMADTLHFSLTQEHLHPAFNALDLELASRGQGAEGQDGEGFKLNIVNAIWGQTGYPFLPGFLDVLAENYGAGLRLLDFQNAPEDSRECINNWVSDQTEDRINDLIPQGSITPLTRLVLTNAIYFNAAWLYPFDEELTQQDGIFHLPGGSQITVPMMSQTEYFRYTSGDGYQAVELPYDGEELSMVVFLPESDRFDEFEASLNAGRVETIINNFSPTYLHLTMPKFEYKFSLGLKDVLKVMGMNDAFDSVIADFSGMDGTCDLYIGDVLHKAFVSVDEAGTEAAVATAVIMVGTGIPPTPTEFTLDHPFIFLIRDIETGAILFVGRVLDPDPGYTSKLYCPPDRTSWTPEGPRVLPYIGNASDPAGGDVLNNPSTYFRALHSDTLNSDEIVTAAAPVFEADWIAEENFYLPEGPTFDKSGNLYFSPLWPEEDVVLVSLDPNDGTRRWAITGFSYGSGAPLILNDPDNPDAQIIYLGLYDRAIAVNPNGTTVWDVSTGLPVVTPESSPDTHLYGINYDPTTDALIGLAGDGHLYALDRKTGSPLLSSEYIIPGEKSPPGSITVPAFIQNKMDNALKKLIGSRAAIIGESPSKLLVDALLGNESKVANYFSVDPHSGRVWVAATAPDDEDGSLDGVSEYGALYCLKLIADGGGTYTMVEQFHTSFASGTAATPALNADGTRVYEGDNFGKLLAVNAADGVKIWDLDVGIQIFASISVASDNNELYLSTSDAIIKVIDKGDHGEEVWRSNLDMYVVNQHNNKNLLTAAICANGIAFQAAHCAVIGDLPPMPLAVGVGLLDRETGEVRYFTKGREESVSITPIGPDGSLYIGHSPVRRALSVALFGKNVPAITGGIQKFSAKRLDLLARDAVHAAADRALNASDNGAGWAPEVKEIESKQIGILIEQCRTASTRAVSDGDLTGQKQTEMEGYLTAAESALSSANSDFTDAYQNLQLADNLLPSK